MDERIALVTGATAGIGAAVAQGLAQTGATVLMVGRDASKLERVVAATRAASGSQRVEGLLADLASLADVARLADEVRVRYRRLNVLVNNAGVVTRERRLSHDGFELQLAVNHLAHFLLTTALLDTLRAGAPARVLNVASIGHANGQIDFDNLQLEQGYTPRRAYYQTKLANVLFTYALARRLEGSGVAVNCLHPGIVRTSLSSDYMGNPIFRFFEMLIAISPERAAGPIVELALSERYDGVSGAYFVGGKARTSSPASYDQQLQERLWADSKALLVTVPALAGQAALQ